MTTSCLLLRFERSWARRKVAAAWYAFAAALLTAFAANAEPYRPQHDDVVLLRVAPSSRVLPRVQTPESLVTSAVQEMAQGRASLEDRHFGRAEALLLRALPCVSRVDDLVHLDACKGTTNVRALITYADLLQHGHEFDNARRVLDAVLEREPSNRQARLMRASIRLARGEPNEALRDCTRLVGATDSLVASACIAQSISLTGRLAEAVDLLSTALHADDRSDAHSAWALAIHSELLERRGEYGQAIQSIERAVDGDPTNFALRIQATDLLLRHGEADRASALLADLPNSAAVVLRRALAARRGSADSDALRTEWIRLVSVERRAGRSTHERDQAIGELYLLNRPTEAVKFAAANWDKSREIEDARILVLAADAAARPEAAAPVRDWMNALRVEDAVLAAAKSGRAR